LDALQAAILDIKLKHLDEYIAARRKAADYYDKAFANNAKITVPFRAANSRHVFHQYTLILNDTGVQQIRDGLNKFLAEKGIPSMIYYPVPCHKQQMFASMGGANFHLPVTDWLTERVISLPIHTELDEEQQDFIISNVLQYIN
jgi:dTDP-4-amino-4,6-dideoxygalactose transaminase